MPTSPDRTHDNAPHRRFAVVGAGLAGIACTRTLLQAGHQVTLFEKATTVGGRMASRETPFGSFDHGAQYFTVRDSRFHLALTGAEDVCRRWSANAVRVLDPLGRVAEAALPTPEAHWVGAPTMDALPRLWTQPLSAAGALELGIDVQAIERDPVAPGRWQLRTEGEQGSVRVFSGFDAVLLAVPAPQGAALLGRSRLAPTFVDRMGQVDIAPCWTLMLAFPQALQPGLPHLGPQWNAALSTHHRIAWLARESSKPRRGPVERWTVQASPAWSFEHLQDDPPRVEAKLLKAFAEVTGIHARPAHVEVKRWRHAKTITPLGRTHLWDARIGLGACGDWCLGHRVENAFVSGLELALAALGT
ncbi:MAG TPA: NAD(P)-binding protein [Ramlibacter sp.]|jgi:predicted NAD/FAD-dependent oxidoreductase|uniref:NAD(P)/FAD-dependent oxidoreductase n=1 Tax=Ramlibacter sp. TaxID=1917967 RepID=UPI002D50EF25|nr:NAD(P)-binding protein [Ramlibacter sp.]HZY19519.1 NAD(P)-binding protein [Ramlibacter sp.]